MDKTSLLSIASLKDHKPWPQSAISQLFDVAEVQAENQFKPLSGLLSFNKFAQIILGKLGNNSIGY